MRSLEDLQIPVPPEICTAARFTLNLHLRQALEADKLDISHIHQILDEIAEVGVTFDAERLSPALQQTVERLAEQFCAEPNDLASLEKFAAVVDLATSLPFGINLWETQNFYFSALRHVYPRVKEMSKEGQESAKTWVRLFERMGEKLRVEISAGK